MEPPGTPRTLRDPRAIRALAHPIRLRLLEALATEGTLTATRASELLGESPASCSFHLRQLARHGFIEEAGGGTGRAHPWRLVRAGLVLDEDADDPSEALAASTVAAVLSDRWAGRADQWRARRWQYPIEWRRSLTTSQHLVWGTAEEVHTLLEEINALIATRYQERYLDAAARPEGARPVEIIITSHPFDIEGGAQ